MIGAVGS